MDEQPRPVSPTLRQHKRQFIWQILIPIVLMAGVIIAAAALVTFGGASRTSLWRDVSLIWLLAPALVLAFLLVIVLGVVIYGMARLTKAAPRFTARAQELTLLGALGVRRIADGAAKPFIWLEQAGAALKSIFKIKR
ncbi:MAG: hypothetical protein HY781_05140 [Chloroflexi bacterium]|nr:hypothetical protein [Chloroflexota bacterium]